MDDALAKMAARLGVDAGDIWVALGVLFLVAVVSLMAAAWLMDFSERGFPRAAMSVFGIVILVGLSGLLLGWIPWVGGGIHALVAWFLATCTLEEMYATSLSRAFVGLGVSGVLFVVLAVGAKALASEEFAAKLAGLVAGA